MNILMDDLPDAVALAGHMVPISTDYRTGILFEQLLHDLTVPDGEKLLTILILYYGTGIFPLLTDEDAVLAALDGIMRFYRCGKDEETAESETEEESSGKDPPFSYEYDALYIYAAFVEAYGIDLTKTRLHWWQFRALFLGLPETVQFCKIMGYRTMEIPDKLPKAQKRFYRRMKRIYRLPEPAEQKQLDKELNDILENGGDISQLIE